ncbi:unnamed protein product [Parnassius apollo]|uniref:(apollo) hypothetical protein n=1 Tax=Parnassius apollo TaxID=110799 RepID=A0A8S3XQ85_PARAO|nr:unnamed protein product [Parnassius apollo]
MKESQEQLLNAKKETTELENQIRELSIKLTTQRDKEQLTSRDKTEINKKNNAFTKQNIFIMGTQQCIGLAAELTKSRMNNRYEDYQVTAFIKPFASTEEVLKLCTNLKVDTHDKVILCVGENDDDPVTTIAELYAALKLLKHATVIVMNVNSSKHLNNNS